MTEESTPLEPTDDTSVETSSADTSVAEPAEVVNEPEADTSEAETSSKKEESQEPQLIFGKYKDMAEAEKGYKELEKVMSQKAEVEKKLKAFEDREVAEREQRQNEARKLGFSDEEERSVAFDVKNHEFGRYVEALDRYLSGDDYDKAYNALARYQMTLNPSELLAAKSCFPPEVISEIAGDVALFRNQKMGEYQERQRISGISRIKENLENFSAANSEWLASEERQKLVGAAIQLAGGDVDLNQVKELIDAVESYAVSSYKEKMQAEAENQKAQQSLQSPNSEDVSPKEEKWLTREEYNNLSPEQEANFANLIEKQILLEKEGKLPRRLI